MKDGKPKGQRPRTDETVPVLEPVRDESDEFGDSTAPDAPGDTLDAPTDAASQVPPTLSLLDAVPDGPGWSVDETSGSHQKPTARRPSRLDVVAAEPVKPRKRRARAEADAFESGRSEPSLQHVEPPSGPVPAQESSRWFWVAVGALVLVAVAVVVVVFF